jgi:hypothetical protein
MQYDQIPEDTKDPNLIRAKKQLKKKMPTKRAGETYWTKEQFEKLRNAPAAKLESRGLLPWRLLAYLLLNNSSIQPLRDLVGRRLQTNQDIEKGQRDLNRMLITLWRAGFLTLEPKPQPKQTVHKPKTSQSQTGPRGWLNIPIVESAEDAEEDDVETPLQNTEAEQVAYELDDYKPEKALPTDRLQYLSQLRSINPIYGLYLVNMLQFADESERIQALESVLELPPNIAKLVRVPPPDQMPAGPLASGVLHPQLLSLGLAVQEELLGRAEPEEPSDEQLAEQAGGAGGKYRKYEPYGEPPPRPLALAEKLRRLFDHEFPGVHDVFTRGVWVVGELLEFEGDFNKYIVARGLQKHEGLLFRHVLRFILLIEEIVQIAPSESSEADWEEPLYALVDRLVECCRKVDPESTDEILQGESKRSHDSAEKKS